VTDPKDLNEYRAGLRRRLEEERELFERERLELLERVRPAGPALRALGAREVFLFGSILRPNFFDRASDIDLLIVGIPDEALLKALGAVERATGIFERELNLVFDQMAPEGLVSEARRTGLPL
jgi:predicted nucleotidyltransferase